MTSLILARLLPLHLTITESTIILYTIKQWPIPCRFYVPEFPLSPLYCFPARPLFIQENTLISLPHLKSLTKHSTLSAWQVIWEFSPSSNWTHSLIPSVDSFYYSNLHTNFFSTQLLSSHGSIGTYLFQIGKKSSALCSCGLAEASPLHLALSCPKYNNLRTEYLIPNLFLDQNLLNFFSIIMKHQRNEELSAR